MASVLDLVKHYQRSIEKYPNDEQKILKCIDKLYNLGVTVQHLQDTGVGRTVNALRKEPGEVGQAARALVLKWKLMVAAEESDQEGDHNDDTTNYSGHDNGRDYESNSSKSRGRHEASEKSDRTPKTEEKYYKHTNGNYSGSKRKYESSEEEEHDTNKSKYSRDNGYTMKSGSKMSTEPDKARSASEDSQDESSQSDSNSEDSQSEEENVPEVKPKIEKKHYIEPHKSSSHTKHSSSSRDKHKQESSHPKQDKEKHNEHNNSSSDKRHSSDKSKEKSHSSHSHKSSREHEKSAEKKDREHRHSEKEKINKEESFSKHSDKHRSNNSSDKCKTSTSSEKHKSVSSSEKHKSVSSSEKHKSSGNTEKHKSSSSEHKHRSSSSSEKNKSNSSEHHGIHSENNLYNNPEKHSSHKSEKERHKRSYENEFSSEKYKSVERISSKDEQSKEKSKEKHNSSKDKDSHKAEKKHSSKDTESSSSKRKSESSHSTSESSKKSKHRSSSSKHKSKSTDEKEKPPKKGEDSDDGIDCGSGASFAEALGMFVSPTKPKKKSGLSKENIQSPNSPNYDLSPANLLAPTTKLAPLPSLEILALPEISPNYRPRPPPKFLPHFNDEDAMSSAISSKNQRTKVYSGNKVIGKITSLYEMCVQVLQEHIDALEYTGGVPYEILKPVVDKATPQQLFVLEHYNPYLMEDTDHLWQKFCEKSFRNKKRQEMETCREMYIRCQEEQEIKLKSLTANIRMTQEAKKAPVKQTKMAYVDSVVKPPRNIAKKQAQHGTAFAATASPAARVASLSATSNVLKGGRAAPAPVLTSNFKPKKAPLMQKALQFMRGRKR